jgi:hypothetical protein
MTLEEAAIEMRRLSEFIDAGLRAMRVQAELLAEAENIYRKGKAEAWARCPNDPPGHEAPRPGLDERPPRGVGRR